MSNDQVFKRCNSASKVTTLHQDLTNNRTLMIREARQKALTFIAVINDPFKTRRASQQCTDKEL